MGNIAPGEVQKVKQNCVLGEWEPWAQCSVTCGKGQHNRMREVEAEGKNGGVMCDGSLSEVSECNPLACPVPKGPKPCEWGEWMEWGACDKCGGQRKRTRQIERMPEDGGEPCSAGASEETQKCKRQCHAPVFCSWSAWEEEGGCSVTCGVGTVKRVRYLQAKAEPPAAARLYEKVKDAPVDDNGRRREVMLSFAGGSMVTFAGVMIAMVALRARRPSSSYLE